MQSLKKKKKKSKVSGLTSDLLNQKAWVWGPASVLSQALQGFLMHATIIELLPVRRGKLMPRGRRLKSGNTSSCLRHLWVRRLLIAGGCPYPKYSHMHTHTHLHIYEHLARSQRIHMQGFLSDPFGIGRHPNEGRKG